MLIENVGFQLSLLNNFQTRRLPLRAFCPKSFFLQFILMINGMLQKPTISKFKHKCAPT